jgi:hypothetical protein
MKQSLLNSRRGSTATEFALVLPLLVLFIFGLIDAGRFVWTWNRAEKAVQMGARMAVVTDVIPGGVNLGGLYAYDYVGVSGLTQGDTIPPSAFGSIVCTSVICKQVSGPTPPVGIYDTASFNRIVQRMQAFAPEIPAENVTVTYSSSGLGYAGDPNGMDVAPLVTVSVSSIPFPLLSSLRLFNANITNVSATLTAEDSSGNQSN